MFDWIMRILVKTVSSRKCRIELKSPACEANALLLSTTVVYVVLNQVSKSTSGFKVAILLGS